MNVSFSRLHFWWKLFKQSLTSIITWIDELFDLVELQEEEKRRKTKDGRRFKIKRGLNHWVEGRSSALEALRLIHSRYKGLIKGKEGTSHGALCLVLTPQRSRTTPGVNTPRLSSFYQFYRKNFDSINMSSVLPKKPLLAWNKRRDISVE